MVLSGRVEVQPLVGSDRDEISALVGRIKRADAARQAPLGTAPVVPEADLNWAAEMQLPREFFEFFELQRG
jgi:hypothetical protein